MIHKGTQKLDTNRLSLEQFKLDDAKAAFKNWVNDLEVTKYLTWNPHGDLSVTRSLIEQWVNEYEKYDNYNWAIHLKDENEVIGSIVIVEIDEKNKSCDIGYCMSKKYWGKGIMTESLNAVIDYLFGEVDFNKITARHDTRNIASGKVMIKNGMKYIKTVKGIQKPNDKGVCNVKIYEIYKNEWGKVSNITV
ncbi:GNAT family N-acetyltransferase [Clostridium sardiniense]|uniref:GNAT family N-acetyltransferase n=1 Tax=Clostridium sardiniense TaxID=29369 RepID=A0ABS7KX34_CLOSR|nr:GNAT family N-acetyltransferase [Clostridium sardiniense]MBY0755345.1 GNAT family N-acetyltransferase [Clostridium sardiniense]MDQ0459791.1 ribosomal-protein-alanine N-acetyltransferase [Clostridium sardiniense]